ncbi:MAG: hypothetical protein KDC79_17080 [Cyclobacteriaceae bacterium]|nr:hypothetical protein [Cyclobacteriaceae bacterium]
MRRVFFLAYIVLVTITFSCQSNEEASPTNETLPLLLKKESSNYGLLNHFETILFSYDDSGHLIKEVRISKKTQDSQDSTINEFVYDYNNDLPYKSTNTLSPYGQVDEYEYDGELLISRKSYYNNELSFTELMQYDDSGNLTALIGINSQSENYVEAQSSNGNIMKIQLVKKNRESVSYDPIIYEHDVTILNPIASLPYRYNQELGAPTYLSKNVIINESTLTDGVVQLGNYTVIESTNSLNFPVSLKRYDSDNNLVSDVTYTYSYE